MKVWKPHITLLSINLEMLFRNYTQMRVTVQNTLSNWVLLNNEMDDFSAKSRVPNMFDQ
jgi:hypothetical protein